MAAIGIAIFLSLGIGLGLKFTISSKIQSSIASALVEAMVIMVFWIVVLLIVIGLGYFFDAQTWVSWTIDFIFLLYAIIGITSFIHMIPIIFQLHGWSWLLGLFGISIYQILLNLSGLWIMYGFLMLFRSTIIQTNGSGFFHWISNNYKIIFSSIF